MITQKFRGDFQGYIYRTTIAAPLLDRAYHYSEGEKKINIFYV